MSVTTKPIMFAKHFPHDPPHLIVLLSRPQRASNWNQTFVYTSQVLGTDDAILFDDAYYFFKTVGQGLIQTLTRLCKCC